LISSALSSFTEASFPQIFIDLIQTARSALAYLGRIRLKMLVNMEGLGLFGFGILPPFYEKSDTVYICKKYNNKGGAI